MHCPYCDMKIIPDSLASTTTSTSESTPGTNEHCAWPTMRLSNALELKSMVELPNQIGQEERRSLQSIRIENQTFDGMQKAIFLHLHFLQSKLHVKKDSRLIKKQQASAACPTLLEGCEWTEAQHEEDKPRYPRPGHDIPANLWNIDIQSRSNKPGPMASFLRHVTYTQSPQNPSDADVGVLPVNDVRDLRPEASLDNVAARQRYLEKFQFEMNTLRCWSSGIQDQILGEAQQVHLQVMRMTRDLQRQGDPQPWAEG